MATLSTFAVALGGAGFLLSLAPLLARSTSPATDTPTYQRPSMQMTRKELVQIARDRKCGTAKFRSNARKADLVRALQAQEQG